MRNTTIVITADHGDELLEHGHVGHASTAHYATLYEELLRIPLLIIDPRIREPRRSQGRVWLADLLPTLLGMAGVSGSGVPAAAQDLSPLFFASLGDGDFAARDRELFCRPRIAVAWCSIARGVAIRPAQSGSSVRPGVFRREHQIHLRKLRRAAPAAVRSADRPR